MSDAAILTSGRSGGDEPVRVLRCLARKTAIAGVTVKLRNGAIELHGVAEAAGKVIATVSPVMWLQWRTKAWVAPATEVRSHETVWHLTARGREQVRRQLSADGEATQPKQVLPPVSPAPRSSRPTVNPNESPIAWLASRRDKSGEPLISAEQFAAAERLRADYWFAGMSPRVTTNWAAAASGGVSGSRTTGADITDNMIAAQARVRHAVTAVGPELASILIDVCCYLKGLEDAERTSGWPQRSAKVVLQLALTRLARHYGLLPNHRPAPLSGERNAHWGAPDYRPRIGSGDD